MTAIPSAIVSAESTATGAPAASDAGNGAHVSTCTPITSTSGRCDFSAIATPLTSPPPPTGTITRAMSGTCAQQLQAEAALAGDHIRVIERVHEREPALGRPLAGGCERLSTVAPTSRTTAPSAVAASTFAIGAPSGMNTSQRHAARARRVGDRLRVVAGAARDDAAGAPVAQRGDLRQRARAA